MASLSFQRRLLYDSHSSNLYYKRRDTRQMMTGKRKATEIDDFQPLIEIDDDGEHLPVVDLECNQVRQENQNFLNSGEMNATNLQRAIGVSSKCYRMFMNKSGHDEGSVSNVYYNAVAFFKKRDLRKSMPPVLPSPPLLPHSLSSPPAVKYSLPAKKKKRLSKAARPYDVSDIELQGEDTESVPIYDSCHEIRKKIKAFFRNASSNESAFCREIAKTFPDGRGVLTKTLNNFMKQKDPHGNQSPAYYASYVFFEKVRIRNGKPKSQDRKKSEKCLGPESEYSKSMSRHVEKRTLDNMGKEVDLGSIAVDCVHCRQGL
ncbi:hypothetical protein BCON_0159g00270 [Botryotinia convoluta]|uniref:DUF7726 domain-containing protein n=1 Tax=Botryotinia convoluta TaxID=54673 RepID=A0A4Z1HR20_9HELO|nr:hypothetical protein BCON_0159g00270 [Botryotinia convoluta]